MTLPSPPKLSDIATGHEKINQVGRGGTVVDQLGSYHTEVLRTRENIIGLHSISTAAYL